ncbi:MAG: hypothetical protein Q7S87_15130, partial [Agitococcus sp.]|nr:hypothetical protein [Agitococcus sp.]
GVPASACLRIAMIWLSLNFDVFMQNLLRLSYEKILLFKEVIYRDDYQITSLEKDYVRLNS